MVEPAVRTFVADDNIVMRAGLCAMLAGSPPVDVVGSAGTGGLGALRSLRPDVVVLGTDPAWWTRDRFPVLPPSTGLLVLAPGDEAGRVARSVRAGATGFLVHGQFSPAGLTAAVVGTARRTPVLSPGAVSAMMDAVRRPPAPPTAVAGRLSPRERELVELIVAGHTNQEIAATLFIAEKTVKNHINRIYAKLGAGHRAAVIALWLGTRSAHESYAA